MRLGVEFLLDPCPALVERVTNPAQADGAAVVGGADAVRVDDCCHVGRGGGRQVGVPEGRTSGKAV